MTFRRGWFSGRVKSSDGYSVVPVGRGSILYEDEVGKVYVSAEMLAPRNAWALYPNDMRIGSKSGEQLRDETRRALIVRRIHEVFAHLGWRLEIS